MAKTSKISEVSDERRSEYRSPNRKSLVNTTHEELFDEQRSIIQASIAGGVFGTSYQNAFFLGGGDCLLSWFHRIYKYPTKAHSE